MEIAYFFPAARSLSDFKDYSLEEIKKKITVAKNSIWFYNIRKIYGNGELAGSRLRGDCIVSTHNLIWVMPT